MTPDARPERTRIAVFAKAPVAGWVKTRLAGVLGPQGAADLHADLVHQALATASRAAPGAVDLWCAPDAHHPFFTGCASQLGVGLRVQQGDNLGDRMANAFARVLASSDALLIIGADCPALTAADLREAVAALETHDAVFAPAEDGGYVLVGLKRPHAEIFRGIDWGTAGVMAQTRARLQAAGLAWRELRTLWDVDRPADLERLAREGLTPESLP